MHIDLVVRTLFMAFAHDTHALLRQSEISNTQIVQQRDERSLVLVPALRYAGLRFPWSRSISRRKNKSVRVCDGISGTEFSYEMHGMLVSSVELNLELELAGRTVMRMWRTSEVWRTTHRWIMRADAMQGKAVGYKVLGDNCAAVIITLSVVFHGRQQLKPCTIIKYVLSLFFYEILVFK
jgi:hypothetical protein